MKSLLEQLRGKLKEDTAALAVIDKVSALHAKTLQEHSFEVSLYRKESFRLQMENNKLRQQVQGGQTKPNSDDDSSPTSSSTTSSQGVIPSLKDELQIPRNAPRAASPKVVVQKSTALTEAAPTDNITNITSPITKRPSLGANKQPRVPPLGGTGREGELRLQSVPLEPPLPPNCIGAQAEDEQAPIFPAIVNYPHPSANSAGNMMQCTMCGQERPLNKTAPKGATFVIPKQNKGVCTSCDSKVWVVKASTLQIKWCKGCKNFQNWAAFGEKGCATKCCACRKRSADTYAAQKGKKKTKIGIA